MITSELSLVNLSKDNIYSSRAYKNQVYLYEDKANALTPQKLVVLIINKIKQDINDEKERRKKASLAKMAEIRSKGGVTAQNSALGSSQV